MDIKELEEIGCCYWKSHRYIYWTVETCFGAGCPSKEVTQIERAQKTAFAIVLGDSYRSYKSDLKKLNMQTLESRRKELCLSFGKRALKNEKYSEWFCYSEEDKPKVNTRYAETKVVTKLKPVTFRTKRYRRSPLPYLTGLLNQHFEAKSSNEIKQVNLPRKNVTHGR